MPGLSLVYRKDFDRSLVLNSLNDLKHEPYYQIEKLVDTSNMLAVFSGYEGYPHQVYESDNTVIFIEGLIYNKSDAEVKSSLRAIARSYTENADYQSQIAEFIDTSDGEFNVLIYSRAPGKFIIFDDRWGRLPSFFYHDKDTLIFSREIKFILPFIPSIEIDRFSVAEWLLFEFALGNKTLIRGITRFGPSSLLDIDPTDSRPRLGITQLLNVSFEEPRETLSRNECIEECKRLLLQATTDRVNKLRERKFNITADLSGGFDTRAVFGALCHTSASIDYYNDKMLIDDESEYAVNVAALFDRKVKIITPYHEMNIPDMSKMIYLTDCGVNGWTALSCYQDQVERFKHIKRMSVQIAAVGCGHFLKRAKISKRYKTITDSLKAGKLVGFGSIQKTCSILKLDEETFNNHLTEYFEGYPELTLAGKDTHWHFEYMLAVVSMGEDRSRLHVWIVEPLWSKDFYGFAIERLPVKYLGRQFYFKFLKALDPRLLRVPVFSTQVIKNSRLTFLNNSLLNQTRDIVVGIGQSNKLVQELLKRYRRHALIKDSNEREKTKHDILENYAKLDKLAAFSDERSIRDAIEDASESQLYRLMTLILYFKEIEDRYGNKCRLPSKIDPVYR